MFQIWLGIAAGIIAIGISVLLGMFIFLGGDLVIHRQNWELAQIIIPAITSVLGWLITIWWAIRQIEISSSKNRTIQHEILISNEKIKSLDSAISAYIDINISLHKIQRRINDLKNNIEFKLAGKSTPDLALIFEGSGSAFSEMFEKLETLKFNIIRLAPYQIDLSTSTKFITDVYAAFSEDPNWMNYQERSAKYINEKSHNQENLDLLNEAIRIISGKCKQLSADALTTVQLLNNPNKNRKPEL